MRKERLIEYKANKFREEHGLSPTEPVNLGHLLTRLNVITLFKEMGDNFSGMAVKNGYGHFMMINANDIIARQRFTIGHELYHLFIQEEFQNRICFVGSFDKKDKEEYNADWFSSYFLIPEDGIIEQSPEKELKKDSITISTVTKLEQYFGVSRSALLNRLKFLDLISSSYLEQLKDPGNIKRNALQMGYSTELYEPGNKNRFIGDYGLKAKQLLDKDLISESDFYSMMSDIGIDPDKNLVEDDKAAG
ncbi:ImmA/IrrE family metallo-endopeptidase [Flavihumibacter rivuli]|uniref:ImmA/IrrE family metallo-endopeptidase n=1 Tax=Flavihumibacter rivuli TaxID=2838156 RepID=UPI001BDF25BB|nr:ImmA/IrrE family metallo-endopeptidase [Flavihumibacter rivuli]ULQ55826.1 ImmA/IrrE family metallo-endopeptidase [Flavihumibacter rivuli]